jgi:hypothetical protein
MHRKSKRTLRFRPGSSRKLNAVSTEISLSFSMHVTARGIVGLSVKRGAIIAS